MKKETIFFALTEFVGLFLAFFAPVSYSFNFCLTLNIIYLILNVYYFTRHRDQIIGFPGLFAFTFYFVNFIYPVVYYPTPLRYISLFSFDFDENIISYATAVALLAYNSYLLGMSYFKAESHVKGHVRLITQSDYKFVLLFFVIAFLIFLFAGGFSYFGLQYSEGINATSGNSLLQYFAPFQLTLLEMVLILLFTQKNIFEKWKTLVIVITFIVIGFYLYNGNRSNPLTLGLIILFMYNDKIKRIKIKYFLLIGIIGVVLFTAIGLYRGTGYTDVSLREMTSEMDSGLDFFTDLVLNNRALYTLISDAKNNGLNPGTEISNFSPLPFMGSILCAIFNVPHNQSGTAVYNSYLSFGNEITLGMGTNAVSDMYIGFGLLGTLVGFYLFGYIFSIYRMKSTVYSNYFYSFIYYCISAGAVFTCRGSIMSWIKDFLWMSIILVFVRLITREGKKLPESK